MEGLLIVEENFGDEVRFHYDKETGQSYVHGADFARVLLFKNPSQAVTNHVWMEYRFKMPVGVGAPAWWLSKAGAYQLLFASDHPKAVEIQRWVFEDVLPKLEADGGYIRPDASQPQLEALAKQAEEMQQQLAIANKKTDTYLDLSGLRLKDFYPKLRVMLGSKFKAKDEHFCDVTADYLIDMNLHATSEQWLDDLGGNKTSKDYYYALDKIILASWQYVKNFQPKALRAFEEKYDHVFEDFDEAFKLATALPTSLSGRTSTFPPLN